MNLQCVLHYSCICWRDFLKVTVRVKGDICLQLCWQNVHCICISEFYILYCIVVAIFDNIHGVNTVSCFRTSVTSLLMISRHLSSIPLGIHPSRSWHLAPGAGAGNFSNISWISGTFTSQYCNRHDTSHMYVLQQCTCFTHQMMTSYTSHNKQVFTLTIMCI